MPRFTPPVPDVINPTKKTPLYLPSGLSVTERACICNKALVKAEIDVCYASMGHSIKELICHLITRTFLHRYHIQNVSGVKANTRAHNGVGSITRCMEATVGAYCRHRVAYKKLVGLDNLGWEALYKPLTATDVQGLSKKALLQQEIQEQYQARELVDILTKVAWVESTNKANGKDLDSAQEAGLTEDDKDDPANIEAVLVPFGIREPGPLAEAVGPGKGCHTIPWIWVVGLQVDSDGTKLTKGESIPLM
jgi:hypothetical protein